jgi:hypothetical protein
MLERDIISQLAREEKLDEKLVKGYIRSFWEGVRLSAEKFEPIAIKDICEFRLHKHIFKYKVLGQDVPMPDGIRKAIEEARLTTHNSRKQLGNLQHYRIDDTTFRLGWIRGIVGDEELLVKPVIEMKSRMVKGRKVWDWGVISEDVEEIGAEQYTASGSIFSWLKKKNLNPVATPKGLHRICKYYAE